MINLPKVLSVGLPSLVAQGRAEPLANDLPATEYIVRAGNTN